MAHVIQRHQLPSYDLTPDGKKKLQSELDTLLIKRPAAVSDIQKAREMGDLSENAFYHTARSKLSSIDSRIRFLQKVLRFAKISKKSTNTDQVNLGSFVTLSAEIGHRRYQLVGSLEADPFNGKISINSPLGQSLLGRSVGDTVVIHTPNGDQSYSITAISLE